MEISKFSGPILVLIWTAYYFAKRYTGGLVDTMDIVVCGGVSIISIVLVIKRGIDLWKGKKGGR
ncbi:MAG: hypothetical protein K2O45_04650 [Oscillospiraceae bacterium]|nr:hypothetical protein [Oscillospiraceae bacterium]